jgi:predicted nucleic acid-binding protein
VIAADTSVWLDFSKGLETARSKQLETTLADGALVMPMPLLFEILSGPGLTEDARSLILELPRLDILTGFWERAGDLRRGLLKKGLKARSMDCLIAQTCIDHGVPLIAADNDYRHFIKAGLKLIE